MPEHLTPQTRVSKVGGIWHGTIVGHPEIDERRLRKDASAKPRMRADATVGARPIRRPPPRMARKTRVPTPTEAFVHEVAKKSFLSVRLPQYQIGAVQVLADDGKESVDAMLTRMFDARTR